MPKLLGRPPKYPFAALEPGGGSFTILPNDAPAGGLTSLQALARYHSRTRHAHFTVLPYGLGGGFLVTRH